VTQLIEQPIVLTDTNMIATFQERDGKMVQTGFFITGKGAVTFYWVSIESLIPVYQSAVGSPYTKEYAKTLEQK
jgi:hypothetical protein